MTHLYIELNTGLTEEVNYSIISKLYELAISGDLDETSDLKGRLHSPSGYISEIEYLNNNFDDLFISADINYIKFVDNNVSQVLMSAGVSSDGIGITISDAANATFTSTLFYGNKNIVNFDEFVYFTKANNNPPGALFKNCTNLSSIDLSNITKISNSEFENTNLSQVVIPEGVSSISLTGFASCGNLSSVQLPQSCISLYAGCFLLCANLANINISHILTISSNVFRFDEKLTGEISLPNLTGLLGCAAFENTRITSITNLGSVESLGGNARQGYGEGTFQNCYNLTSVNIPNTVQVIGRNCFTGCLNLAKINSDTTGVYNINNNVTSIGNATFEDCKSLVTINIQGSITSIEDLLFSRCSALTTVNIPSTVSSFGERSFAQCSNLTTINIPNTLQGVTTIPTYCFSLCKKLTALNIDWSSITSLGSYAFHQCCKLALGNLVLPSVTSIGTYAFESCEELYTIGLSNSLINTIGAGTFKNCNKLTSVTLPSTCTTISTEAFLRNSALLSINLNNVTSIGKSAFLGCSKLTSIDLSNITALGISAFDGCTLLSSLNRTTFSGITSLHAAVFKNCSNLTGELSFPDLTELIFENGIRGSQFQGCANLTKISLGHLVVLTLGYTSDSDAPFKDCTNLKIVDLGDSLTTLSDFNFSGCSNLKAIKLNVSTPPSRTESAHSNELNVIFGNNNVDIYVPDAAVSTYLTTSPYSNFASHIKPLSTYNEASILAS